MEFGLQMSLCQPSAPCSSWCAHQGPCLARGKETWAPVFSSCGFGTHCGLPGHLCPLGSRLSMNRRVQALRVKSTLSCPAESWPLPVWFLCAEPLPGNSDLGEGGCLWSPCQPAKWVTKEGKEQAQATGCSHFMRSLESQARQFPGLHLSNSPILGCSVVL